MKRKSSPEFHSKPKNSIYNIPPELFVYMLVFFVLGILIYAFMFGAVGSTASKLENINTSVMPIAMLFIIAFITIYKNE